MDQSLWFIRQSLVLPVQMLSDAHTGVTIGPTDASKYVGSTPVSKDVSLSATFLAAGIDLGLYP